MAKKVLLDSLQNFILSAIPETAKNKWFKAELHVWVQPNFMKVYGYYFTPAEETPLEMNKGREERKRILSLLEKFHKLTANQGKTNWNTGLFTLVPSGALAYSIRWDQTRQDEVNAMNRENARAAGIEYVEPVWDWD